MKIKRELYVEHPRPGYAVFVGASYTSSTGLERIETMSFECEGRSDLPVEPQIRYSSDNGRTWTTWQRQSDIVAFKEDSTVVGFLNTDDKPASGFEDPFTGFLVSIELRQTIVKGPVPRYRNHCFWRMSRDNGRTWTKPQLLRYEEGNDLDPENPLDPAFLENNSLYSGGLISHSNGTLIFCGTSVNIPKDTPHTDPDGKHGHWWVPSGARDIGSALFIARWDSQNNTYQWQKSNCVWVPMSVSCRGLLEGYPVELVDGGILVIWRGSDTPETPGRKWFSVSEDGGVTLSPVQELKYDDGTRFYSPSSIHYLIRHSVNGKLHWLANICAEPPHGNEPRYPLVIAEVDEKIPAIKRDTVQVIVDRGPEESEGVQWSNFSPFENRETHELELYMTPIGSKATYQEDPVAYWEADCFKFTISLD